MRIGIDIDDTVACTYEFIKEQLKDKINLNETNDKIYFAYEEVKKYFKDESDKTFLKIKPKENAIKIINLLKENGHQIFFITARYNIMLDEPYNTTKKWLDNLGFKYDQLLVGKNDKQEVCKNLSIDLFIDDAINHYMSVSEVGIDSILYTSYFNKFKQVKTRINDWNDLLKMEGLWKN